MQEQILEYWAQFQGIALEWLTSPQAYVQFGLLVGTYLAAVVASRYISPRLSRLIDPGEAEGRVSDIRRYVLQFMPLTLPLLAYAFIGGGESIIRSIFPDAGGVIAFGKRVFIFLAVRILVRDIIKDPFLKALGKYIFIPMAALYAVGLLETVQTTLSETFVGVGQIQFSVLSVIRAGVIGSILFWLGQWSAGHGTGYIRAQEEIRPPIRELAAKTFEMVVWGVAFLLLINVLGVDMSALAILSGAIGVGLGFGLQKIASNFISGVILLLEGQITVGDFVTLDGGEEGTIVNLGMRATTMETFDGKWIMVPNEDFITSRVVNWSDQGSGNRYEAPFSVAYATDINTLPGIVNAAVAALDFVKTEPEGPDCELVEFGDNGIHFVVEYWVDGIDDGRNKFKSHVMFAIWNALRDAGVEMPFPQRDVWLKNPEVLRPA